MGKGAGSGEGWGESDTKGGHGEWKHGLCGSCSPVGDCKCAYLKNIYHERFKCSKPITAYR